MKNEIKEKYVRLVIDRKLVINELKTAEKTLRYENLDEYVKLASVLSDKLENINLDILKMRDENNINDDDVYALEMFGLTHTELISKLDKLDKKEKSISLQIWRKLFVERI